MLLIEKRLQNGLARKCGFKSGTSVQQAAA
jgi:hypothetical protein